MLRVDDYSQALKHVVHQAPGNGATVEGGIQISGLELFGERSLSHGRLLRVGRVCVCQVRGPVFVRVWVVSLGDAEVWALSLSSSLSACICCFITSQAVVSPDLS